MLARYTVLLLILFGRFNYALSEQLDLQVHAEAAILMNADTGIILYEKNSKAQLYPASITKIATAAYAIQKRGLKLERKISADQEPLATVSEDAKRRSNYTLPAYWLVPGGTHIGIKKGEELTLKDLLYGMMIASGNDASNVIAQDIGGTIPAFMEGLNEYLRSIGCKDTTFYNPHGLHHPKHLTSAYDMALMTIEALKSPIFREIVSTVRYTRPKTNKQEATTLVQSNRLLKAGKYYYPKAIGVKTGYTSQAMNTFVAAAKDKDRTLIAVLLKSKEREEVFQDAIKLFDSAFNQPKVRRVLVKAGPQKVILELPGANKPVGTYAEEEIATEYYPAEEPVFKGLLHWDEIKLPISKGQRLGVLEIQTGNGAEFKSTVLYADSDAKATWLHWLKGLAGF